MTVPAATLDPLFTPARIGTLELANRIVMAPMTRCFAPNGVPGADVARYYRRRAEGGVGLIVTEGAWIPHPGAANDERTPRLYGEDALAGWRAVVREVHAAGGKIMPQLWHVGLSPKPELENLYDKVDENYDGATSPSGYVTIGRKVTEGSSEADIVAAIAAYAQAAANARACGFDGIEIHGAHGYLPDQFFWHETNHRRDHWGGPTLKERARFGVEVVRACRAATAPDFPIVFRFSQWKGQDYNARLAQSPQELAPLLEQLSEAGVDAFHASQRRFWEPAFKGSPLNLAGWARALTGKPAITVGSIGLTLAMEETWDAGMVARPAKLDAAAEMVARGEVDFVAIGRALIADAELVAKVRAPTTADSIAAYEGSLLANFV
ncbi:MAG: hypothetical protein RIS94_199 [Pseudomonadota bacterium]|jgi:2,4-dienoyl-CoA reductase-like NADH-dependent reductase (Old Yellow Enzyme family)